MIFMSVGHSLSFRSLRRTTKPVHYESFKNCIYSKVAENSSNHLSHDNFHIRGRFCKLQPFTTQTKFRFVRSCWELNKDVLS